MELGGIPIILLWIMGGSIFFTLFMGFVNVTTFKHAFDILRGKYEEASNVGEVSHFKAFSTALSASVGLGNIAGVAIAIQVGGAGAVFWLTVAGFLGMSSKFVECTLGQKYRRINPDGTVSGGPMYYLSQGLGEIGLPNLGHSLALLFAIFCLLASLGGGNMFQVNQSFAALSAVAPILSNYNWLYGLVVASVVGLVIIGGIRRIGTVTSAIVPVMVGVYALACLWILGCNLTLIPGALQTIIQEAFSPTAIEGGVVGVFVQGVRRSIFSNGAGLGGAAIAHSASCTKEPIREGIVASLEPFIDTIIICNLTALVIVVTSHVDGAITTTATGVELTAAAFASVISWFPSLLAIIVFLFAFSTIISCYYYGEKAWGYLFGNKAILVFQLTFLFSTFLGPIVNLRTVLDFSDILLFAMAIPNLCGCILLSGRVLEDLQDYLHRYDLGMIRYVPKWGVRELGS